jgi:hypothetical protein
MGRQAVRVIAIRMSRQKCTLGMCIGPQLWWWPAIFIGRGVYTSHCQHLACAMGSEHIYRNKLESLSDIQHIYLLFHILPSSLRRLSVDLLMSDRWLICAHSEFPLLFYPACSSMSSSILLLLPVSRCPSHLAPTHHSPQAAAQQALPCAPKAAASSFRAIVRDRCSCTAEEAGDRRSSRASRAGCSMSIRAWLCLRNRYRCSALEAPRVVAVRGVCRPLL